jgi:hypothetical protein
MRLPLRRAYLLLILAFISVAAQSREELSVTDARTDFDVLRRALEETHGGLHRFTTASELQRRFDEYRARLTRPVSQREFIGLLSEMIADIRDGHARLEYDEATNSRLASTPLFPLRLSLEGPRVVVLFNDTMADSTIRPGMEVVSINDRPISQIVSALLPKLPGDGFIETGKRIRLGRTFGAAYWLFVDDATQFTVVAQDQSGKQVTATLAGVLSADRAQNANPVNALLKGHLERFRGSTDNVSLQFVTDPDIARLRIRSFDDGDGYPASIAAAFRSLRDKGTKALILDLRGNGGGVDLYGALLVAQFTDKPFRYFDKIHLTTIRPSFATWKPSTFDDLRNGTVPDQKGGHLVTATLHQGIAEQAPGAAPFLGKVIVLLDGGTFSTSADVTATLHHLKRATFVGEESGGTYEGNTSGLNALVVLPNSKLAMKIMMYGYWNAASSGAKGRGTLPDYPVEKRVADLLEGVDKQMEQAVSLARASLVVQSAAD